jgi:hypothetical protein
MVTRARALIAVIAAILLGGCDLGSATIPLTDPQIVVHAVLNPTLSAQTFLIEESLTGKITADEDRPFDPNSPIISGNGVPVTGAVVRLTTPSGAILTASEQKIDNQPTGIYTILTTVQPGGRYHLTITALGKTVTGSTLIPRSNPPIGVPEVVFNRDHQSVSLPINDVDLARAYWVRVEAPLSAFSVFTTDRQVAISGNTRNLFTDDLLRVFFPGFRQLLTVAAVDTNLFDYYRSANDPFSGTGLINHLEGGIGVFGSIAMVERRILDVTQDSTGDSIEGIYTLRSGGNVPHTLRLYVESLSTVEGVGDRISGNYVAGPQIAPIRGAILGEREVDVLTFESYEPLSTSRRVGSFLGRIAGDTVRGVMQTAGGNSGAVVYVRQGK